MTPETQPMIQPPLRAAPQDLFPTMDSLEAVIELGQAQLPITNQNDLVALLMSYHNTLLRETAQEVVRLLEDPSEPSSLPAEG